MDTGGQKYKGEKSAKGMKGGFDLSRPYRAYLFFCLLPRALPWAIKFCPFRALRIRPTVIKKCAWIVSPHYGG
jgi:hypothetical protein